MDGELSPECKAANHETWKHIHRVQQLMHLISTELMRRAIVHDQTKLEYPEVQLFAELTPRLAGMTFGSPEYKECKKQLGPALAHHYARNRHHPEFHKRGIEDMNLVDLVEMLVDWKASSERHIDGNIRRSIDINADVYGIPDRLKSILENTLDLLD
jgi:hypothetical protein